MIMRGGVFGVQRIARHPWRMSFGPFVASGSSLRGQQQVFPASSQISRDASSRPSASVPSDFLAPPSTLREGIQKLPPNRGDVQSPST